MYAKPPSADELQQFGFLPEDIAEVVEVWPANWPAFSLFEKVSTQWRDNGYDPVGLDYAPVFHLMDKMALDSQEWDELFDSIRILEHAAMTVMRENRSA